MKTQIITLESHDDLISVRDRMSWAKTPRILLVWPKYETATLRQADLKVLQRHASSLGAQLGLVTRRRAVQADAEELGIPVFESTGQAQKFTWPGKANQPVERRIPNKSLREKRDQLPVKREAARANPIARVLIFIVGVVSVLALVALFIPRAQIQIKPETKTQSILIPITANAKTEQVFISGSIPAREKRIVVDGSQKIVVTGQGITPESKATGIALFRNLTQSEVVVPTGVVVRAGDIRFVTTASGSLKAGVDETLELPIEAEHGGTDGNFSAGEVNIVDGALGLTITVTNPKPTSGGRERATVQATDADRARVKDSLLAELESDARASLLDELNSDDLLFDESFALAQILSEEYDLPAGASGAELILTMRAEYFILYASASDLTELASLSLNASLPEGFTSLPGTIDYENETQPVLAEDGSMHWMMRAQQTLVQRINSIQLGQNILGLSVADAQRRLDNSMPASNHPQISMSPSWWPWTPLLPFRIEVVTE